MYSLDNLINYQYCLRFLRAVSQLGYSALMHEYKRIQKRMHNQAINRDLQQSVLYHILLPHRPVCIALRGKRG